MANVLAVGIAALDIVNTTDGFPKEDEEVRAIQQDIRRGGNATNTLVVLSQLGHQCFWLGCLANDNSAGIIKNDLGNFGVNYKSCEIHPSGVTPVSYITLNCQNGSRTIVHYRDLPELSANTFKSFPLTNLDWIHFEGRNVTETQQMLSFLKKSNSEIPVSIEIEKPRENLQKLFYGADVYFFSKAFALSQNFEDAKDFLYHYRTLIPNSLLVCSWSSEGAYVLTKDQLHFSSAPTIKAIDTIGAGDTFNAGFIHAQLQGENPKNSLKSACELAAVKCTKHGFNGLV